MQRAPIVGILGLALAGTIYFGLGWQGLVGFVIGAFIMEGSAAFANGQWRD